MRHHDDLEGEQRAMRVSVSCTSDRDVILLATQQQQLFDLAAVRVSRGRPQTVWLQSESDALASSPGVARITALQQRGGPGHHPAEDHRDRHETDDAGRVRGAEQVRDGSGGGVHREEEQDAARRGDRVDGAQDGLRVTLQRTTARLTPTMTTGPWLSA